jgi:hypothetical protein
MYIYHSDMQCASSQASKQILFCMLELRNISLQNFDVADSGEMNTIENFPSLIPVKLNI